MHYLLILYYFFFFWVENPKIVQEAKADFEKVNQTFSVPKFSVQMTYNIYGNLKDVTPSETNAGRYFKNEEVTYSNLSGIESIRTKNMTIAIQNHEKVMVVANAAKKGTDIAMTPDTLLSKCDKIIKTEIAGNIIKYELVFGKKITTEFEKIEVWFNKQNYQLNKIIMFYSEQEVPSEDIADKTELIHPKMEVVYKNYTTNFTADNKLFNESNYVIETSKNKYKGTGKYSNYKVYNQKFK